MNYLIADLRKLRRPLMLWLSLAMVALSLVLAVTNHAAAREQAQMPYEELLMWQTDPPTREEFERMQREGGVPPDRWPEYEQFIQENIAQVHADIPELERELALPAATRSPLGALGLALGYVGSMLGAFILLLGAAAHVAGEWNGSNVKEVFTAEGRRGRFVLVKTVSIFLFGLWLLLCSWLALTLWGVLSRHIFPLPDPASTATVLDWMEPRLWWGPLVLLVFAAVAVALATVIRQPVGTLLAGGVIIFVLNYIPRFDAVVQFSPAAWVASLMDFHRRFMLIDFVWTREPLRPADWISAILLAAVVVAAVSTAVVFVRRRDVA